MGTGFWREQRADCDGVWEQVDGESRGQSLTVFLNSVLEEERAECDCVWKLVVGETRGESVTVLGNRLLNSR